MDANSISVNCLLETYKAIYGEIVFPDKPGEGQAKKRRDIYANPAGWMYSFDGLRWQTAPMDIGKIDYPRAMFRKIPAGIIVGVNDTVKKSPGKLLLQHGQRLFLEPCVQSKRPYQS